MFLPEIALVFALLEIRIWLFDAMGLLSWLASAILVLLVLLSWRLRKDNLKSLGIAPDDFKKDLFFVSAVFLILWIIVMLIGEIWNPSALNQSNWAYNFCKSLLLYYPWAWLQQLWLNGYFANRLNDFFEKRGPPSCLAGFLFGIVHLPNPVLFPVAWLGGTLSAYFFLRSRNLYFLALFHAIIAVSAKIFLPPEWHHNLRIGPGFFAWSP